MLIFSESNSGLKNLLNSRFVYQERPVPAGERPVPAGERPVPNNELAREAAKNAESLQGLKAQGASLDARLTALKNNPTLLLLQDKYKNMGKPEEADYQEMKRLESEISRVQIELEKIRMRISVYGKETREGDTAVFETTDKTTGKPYKFKQKFARDAFIDLVNQGYAGKEAEKMALRAQELVNGGTPERDAIAEVTKVEVSRLNERQKSQALRYIEKHDGYALGKLFGYPKGIEFERFAQELRTNKETMLITAGLSPDEAYKAMKVILDRYNNEYWTWTEGGRTKKYTNQVAYYKDHPKTEEYERSQMSESELAELKAQEEEEREAKKRAKSAQAAEDLF